MADTPPQPPHAIVAGFGLPGRMAAEWLEERGIAYSVVELNPQTVERCGKAGTKIIAGSITEESTLRAAGIDSSFLLILAVPNDQAVLEAITLARKLNPTIQIIARCAFTSVGFEATRRGADKVIVAEQVVAGAFVKMLADPVFGVGES